MDNSREQRKLGYSKPSSQVRSGPAPLASFEDLPTDDQFSEASLIEDLPCVSECFDDRIFHDDNLSNKRKMFQRTDTSYSADMNGSLITITSCSITPTELESPTKTLTPITPTNPISNQIINYNQSTDKQNQLFYHNDEQSIHQFIRPEMPSNRQSNEILNNQELVNRVPLSPSIILNEEIIDLDQHESRQNIRKGSWTNFFTRNRSKSTASAKSPTLSITTFFSPKQSTTQLDKPNQIKPKKRRMSNLFNNLFSTFKKKSTRSSLQDLSCRNENNLNQTNLLSTNLDKIASASSPKVLNDYSDEQNHLDLNCDLKFDDYIERNRQAIENRKESSVISLKESIVGSQGGLNEFQIEIVIKEKDEEFDKKMKEDIYLEEKILDEDIILPPVTDKKSTMQRDNEMDKKEVLLKRTLKERESSIDEIRSLPGRLPSFRKNRQTNQSNGDSSINQEDINHEDMNSESDDPTTITDQLSSKIIDYNKKNVNNSEITNLLDDEDSNDLCYKIESNNSPSRLKLRDRNERMNIKIIPIERPRSVTPVNFSTFETFISTSSVDKDTDKQDKIKLKLPVGEDAFNELMNTNTRKISPRKSSPQIWLDWESSLLTPKYNTRRNSNIDESNADRSQTISIANSSTNETISEYLNDSQQDNGFEDDFMNVCLADLVHVIHKNSEQIQSNESFKNDNQSNESLSNQDELNAKICFETNFTSTENELKSFDQNNNLINDNNCEKCKLNQLMLSNEQQCNCHVEKKFNYQFSPKRGSTIQRRHSISSDLSSASSRLICSSNSSSSSSTNSSRRISIRDTSNERLEA